MQILRLTIPDIHPSDEDLSLGTPELHPSDEDLSLGTPEPRSVWSIARFYPLFWEQPQSPWLRT